jgi:prepilin-type N-terminal cleavage/methylation domain-containing protein
MKNLHPRITDRGLTLIELLVTILLLGVVATIAIPIIASSIAGARSRAAVENTAALQVFEERWEAASATFIKSDGFVTAYIKGKSMEKIKDADGQVALSGDPVNIGTPSSPIDSFPELTVTP